MKSKGEAPDSLSLLHRRVGLPESMISDDAPELFVVNSERGRSKLACTSPHGGIHTPQHNMADEEGDIRDVEEGNEEIELPPHSHLGPLL